MAEDEFLRRDLLARIEARRAAVTAFLHQYRPRIRRRATITIVLSALAAAFTAGPALGGQTFADSVQSALNLQSDSFVWRTLCLLALIVSITAAVLTNVAKAQDETGRLGAAEAASAELEGLSTMVQFGRLPLEDAVKLYQQYSVKIPFIEDLPAAASRQPYPGPAGYGQYGRYPPPPR